MVGGWGLIGFFAHFFFKRNIFFKDLLFFFFLCEDEGEQVLRLFLESLVFFGEVS